MATYKKVGQYKKPLIKEGENSALKTAYVTFDEAFTAKKGDTLQFETKAFKLASLKDRVASGKLTEETAEKAEYVINKTMPDFVIAEVVLVNK